MFDASRPSYPASLEIKKDQISNVVISGVQYNFRKFQECYMAPDNTILKIGKGKVTALFPWDEKTYLAHVEGRILYIPALISENGNTFRGVPLGIARAVRSIIS